VLGLALRETFGPSLYLLKLPGILLRALLSVNLIMPAFVAIIVALVPLNPDVKIALIAIALSPVPPILTNKAHSVHRSHTVGLLMSVSLIAVIFVPTVLWVFGTVFQGPYRFDLTSVIMTIVITILIPLAVGTIIRRMDKDFADIAAGPVSWIGLFFLILSFLPSIPSLLPTIWTMLGDGTALAMGVFVAFGLAVGHLLGGPYPHGRNVLALASASRHPGFAVVIVTANIRDPGTAIAGIILYLLIDAILALAYIKFLTRAEPAEAKHPVL
jgi:BASS family bile acid:Na+ symporter